METEEMFSYFFLALSIVLIILGSISNNGAKSISDSTKRKNSCKATKGIIIIGVFFLLGSCYVLFGKHLEAFINSKLGN